MGEIHKLITVYDVLSTVHNKRRVLGGMAHCQLLPEGQSEESAPRATFPQVSQQGGGARRSNYVRPNRRGVGSLLTPGATPPPHPKPR